MFTLSPCPNSLRAREIHLSLMLNLLLWAQIIGGLIAGSAAVVIAIVVLAIVCFCIKKAKTKRKEMAHEERRKSKSLSILKY